ncbi:hypothetical protein DFH11DRAFT_1593779 [Phellopilus nigrolimitatus]|nr:hypothetical protein DFH11DRAFT_1593779 [Phellopilus nigrolimitatus]
MLAESQAGSNVPQVKITEDEAAVYDRQIRLWGLEAQQRMRNATIMVVRLRGVATETIKNVVLAGIGKLIVVDDEIVSEADLGAGFFYCAEDVGQKRVETAKSKIQSLNPLVTVETVHTLAPLHPQTIDATLQSIDLMCITDADRDLLIRVNDACRRQNKSFYAGGSYGLVGYIFCDLINHEYLAPDTSDLKDLTKRVKKTLPYCPLSTALKPYSWNSLTRVQTRDLNPAVVFSIFGLWEFQARNGGKLPDEAGSASEIEEIAGSLFAEADVHKRVLKSMPKDIFQSLATTAAHEFSPVCAVLGGLLAQDMLKALAAREPPIANFFFFDGNTGHGSVCRMNM